MLVAIPKSKTLRREFLNSFVLAVGVGVGYFFVEFAFGRALQDFLVAAQLETNARGSLARTALLLFGAGLLRTVVQVLSGDLYGRIRERIRFRVRQRVVDAVFLGRLRNTSRGTEILSDSSHRLAVTSSEMHQGTVQVLIAALSMAALFYLSWKPALYLLVGFVVTGLLFYPLILRMRQVMTTMVSRWSSVHERIARAIQNMVLMRIYGMAERERVHGNEELREAMRAAEQHARAASLTHGLPYLLGLLLVIGPTALHAYDAGLGDAALSFFYLSFRFLSSAATGFRALAEASSATHVVNVVDAWFLEDEAMELRARQATWAAPATSPTGLEEPLGWEVRNLQFRYNESDPFVLQNLSFSIRPGSCYLLEGSSGVGKSTLVAILLGIETKYLGRVDVSSGSESGNAAQFVPRFTDRVGYVGAESFLIDGTVRENLLYGMRHDITDAQIEEALDRAQCGFSKKLPGGLSYRLGERGEGLSAGQKQRLCLARALLRRPIALILDEPTANLDLDTEERIVDLLASIRGSATIVLVSHRPAFRRIADERLLLGNFAKAA